MQLNEYISQKTNDFIRGYGYPESKIKYSLTLKPVKDCKHKYEEIKKSYSKINKNDDIERLENILKHSIQQYKIILDNDKPLSPVDFFELDLAVFHICCGLQVLSRNIDNTYCNFTYTKDDIDSLFVRLNEYAKQIGELSQRWSCKD